MCLILTEKKGRTSLCCELGGGWRDPGVEAAAWCSCLGHRNPLGRSREKFYLLGSIWVGSEELLGAACCGAGLGGCCGLIPALLHPCRGALLAPCVGETRTDFLCPFSLGPGTGGGWKGELQPRARRDVCPQGRDPRDCCNPGSLFPVIWGCAAGLTGCSSFFSRSNPVTISSVTTAVSRLGSGTALSPCQ